MQHIDWEKGRKEGFKKVVMFSKSKPKVASTTA